MLIFDFVFIVHQLVYTQPIFHVLVTPNSSNMFNIMIIGELGEFIPIAFTKKKEINFHGLYYTSKDS